MDILSCLVESDIAAYKRVNKPTRAGALATKWIYQHNGRWIEERLEPTGANVVRVLAELLVNVALIRNTLSTHVRVKLQKGTFPWLLLDGWDIMNNIHEIKSFTYNLPSAKINELKKRWNIKKIDEVQL